MIAPVAHPAQTKNPKQGFSCPHISLHENFPSDDLVCRPSMHDCLASKLLTTLVASQIPSCIIMHNTLHIAFHQLQGRHMRYRCRQISSSTRMTQCTVLTDENEYIVPVRIRRADEESSSPVQTKAASDIISPSAMTLFILLAHKNRIIIQIPR